MATPPPNSHPQAGHGQPYPNPSAAPGQPYPHLPSQPEPEPQVRPWNAAPGAFSGCQFCGGTPAITATIRGHQGFVVVMRFRKMQGEFCRSCGIAVHRDMSAKTMWQGWWGIGSFFITPIILLINLMARSRFGKMPHPAGGWRPPLDPGKPVFLRAGVIGLLVPLAILGAVIVGTALDDSAATAQVGDCVQNQGSAADPDLRVVDCTSTDADFKVVEKLNGTSGTCDRSRYAEYHETHSPGDSFVLCLSELAEVT